MAAASQRAIRLLAGANVAALGTLGAAVALKPDGDATTGGVVAQAEAVGRAARLAGTLAVVAADYKGVEWFSNETKDASASERLKKAMAEQELSGLEVERAKDAAAREAGVRRAAAAREAVLRESAAVAAEGSATTLYQKAHSRNDARLLHLARANGGVYVKIAQHCAQLDYLLPPEYTTAFASCLDDAARSSWDDVRAVVKEELGAEPDEAFDAFEREPIASASLAQVHRAVWKGRDVAVKVQHRGLRETSVGDLALCGAAVGVFGKLFPAFRMQWVVDEIAPHLPRELDFVAEAANCRRCAKTFERWPDVVVPEVFDEATSARVLTMSWEPGVNGTRKEEIRDALGLDPTAVAALVSTAFAFLTFHDGHVHCDPHAANVLVRASPAGRPQLVLLDHGLYRELDDEFRLEWARLWRALALADVPGIRESAEALGVGDLYPLFAAMLTQRPWDDVVNPDLDSLRRTGAADDAMLREYAQRYAQEITVVLDRVPRQLLLLLKMSDCLRHLDRSLGGTTNTDVVTAHACADALYAADGRFRSYLRVKLRLWAYEWLSAFRGANLARQREASVSVPEMTSGFAKDDRGV